MVQMATNLFNYLNIRPSLSQFDHSLHDHEAHRSYYSLLIVCKQNEAFFSIQIT